MRFRSYLPKVFKEFGVHGVGLGAVWILFSGCAPARTPGVDAGPTVSLRISGSPPDAAVVIDDNALGTLDFVAARGVALRAGVHHVTVTAAGYFPWDRAVRATVGAGPIRLAVTLVAVPD